MFYTHDLIREKNFGFWVEEGKEEDKGKKEKNKEGNICFSFIL